MIFSAYSNKRLASFLLFWAISFTAWAQGQPVLNGRVTDSEGKPILGVRVEAHENGKRAFTDSSGAFTLRLSPGHYHLHFERKAYRAQELSIYFPETKRVAVQLSLTSIELAEVLLEETAFKRSEKNLSQTLIRINPKASDLSRFADLSTFLSEQPGVQALNTGVGIAKPIIRGMMGQRVAVFDEGIKQEGQQWGMDHGLEIDPFQASRIELIKGPAALQYGADAIGGVVRILPEAIPDSGWHGGFRSIYKSNNQHWGGALSTTYRKEHFFLIARYSRQRFSDFRVPATEFTYNSFILPITDNTLKNTAGELSSYKLQLGWQKPSYQGRFTYSFYDQIQGLYPGATGIPRALDVGTLGALRDINLPRQEIKHHKLSTNQNIKIGEHWLEWELGYQFNDRAERSIPHAHGFQTLDSSQTLGIGLQLHTLSSNLRYHWEQGNRRYYTGLNVQYQRNLQDGFEFLIPSFEGSQGGLFFLAQESLSEKWAWNGGLRYEWAQWQAGRTDIPWWQDPDSLALRSPSIDRYFGSVIGAAGLTFTPSPLHTGKLHLSRVWRAPLIAELASNGVHHGTFRHEQGDANLDAEQGWQIDAEWAYQRERFYLRLSPYYSYFQNYIFLRPSARFSRLPEAGQVYVYEQDPVVRTGAELWFDWHPISKLHFSNGLEYLYTYNLNTRLALPFTPPLGNLFSVAWEEEDWSLELKHQFAAAQNQVDRNEAETPAYHLFHATLSYQWEWLQSDWQLSISGQNLFNRAYLNHLSRYRLLNLPEQGRNIVVSLSLDF